MKRVEDIFVFSSAGILLVIGLAKLASASGVSRVLDQPDPLLFMTSRQLLISVGLVEILTGCWLLSANRAAWFKLPAIVFLSLHFMLYRIGLWWIDAKKPCPCLGHLTDMLALSPRTASTVSLGLLGFLFVGSSVLLLHTFYSSSTRQLCPAHFKK